jgi:hypothetical protein
MINRAFMAACLVAALVACDRPQQPLGSGGATRDVPPPVSEPRTVSAMPEHFDRVRAEQFEKEEERLRRRAHR